MASNRLPDGFAPLVFLAHNAFLGAEALGAEIPLLINTAPVIAADRAGAMLAEAQYGTAQGALPARFATLKSTRAEAEGFALTSRDWLKNFLGRHAGGQWIAAGWSARSIAIPEDDARLGALLEMLGNYLAAHPDQECAALNVTAARAAALNAALEGAVAAVNAQKASIGTKRAARDAGVETLRARLRGLRGELSQRLGAADPRWTRFGFNMPAQKVVPSVPQGVVVNAGGAGQLFVRCEASAHAKHYRFFTRATEGAEEIQLAGRSAEPLFVISGLTPGKTYEVLVRAANEAAESGFSEPVTAVVGGVAGAA